MSFIPYEDVPLYLALDGQDGEYIFAESASLSVNQSMSPVRQLDDNILQICAYGDGSSMSYSSTTFSPNTPRTVVLGPSGGPPRPLATSIYRIAQGTKITFPNNKVLYFTDEIFPDGHNFIVKLEAKDESVTLTEEEAQNGYFVPEYQYVTSSAIVGSLSVNFYINEGNLPNFFNITGLALDDTFPPINDQKVTGFLGDFAFHNAYLTNFQFGISPNSLFQASASFDLYGNLTKDESFTANYYSSELYAQQSIPHGQTSQVLGASSIGMEHVTSLSYSISVSRNPAYEAPTCSTINDNVGLFPKRVSRGPTTITMSLEAEGINPDLLAEGFNGQKTQVSVDVKDLNYENFEDNSVGLLQTFSCNGVVSDQALSVSSQGYLNGSVTLTQNIQ